MGNNRKADVFVNLGSNIVSFLISVAIGFFLSPFIIKHLGAEANGFTHLANNIITYATLLTIALNSMAARFMSIEYHRGNREEVKKYYSALVVGNVFIVAILFVIACIFTYFVESFINVGNENINDIRLLFGLVFLNFFISQACSVFGVATYITNKLYYTNIISMFGNVLKVFILVALFGFFKPQMYYVSLAGVIISVFTLLMNFSVKKKLLPEIVFEIKSFDIRCIIKLLSSGTWNAINQCGNILMTGLDLLLTNIFINPFEMGMMSVAKMIPNHIMQLAGMVNNNFAPDLTITYATAENNDVVKRLRWSMKISSVFMTIPIGVLVVFGGPFYRLWTPSLDSQKLVVLSFLSCMMFVPFAGTQTLYNVYATTNKLKVNSLTVVAGGLINVIVVYLLLKFSSLGVYAVAGVSSLVSIVRNLVVTVPYTARILKLKWYEFYKDVLISCGCFAIVVTVSLLVKNIINCDGWVTLVFAVFASTVLGFAAELALLVSPSERKRLFTKIVKRSRNNG